MQRKVGEIGRFEQVFAGQTYDCIGGQVSKLNFGLCVDCDLEVLKPYLYRKWFVYYESTLDFVRGEQCLARSVSQICYLRLQIEILELQNGDAGGDRWIDTVDHEACPGIPRVRRRCVCVHNETACNPDLDPPVLEQLSMRRRR